MQSVPITTLTFRQGVLETTLCDRFVSDLRQVGGFLRVFPFPPPIKLTAIDITEILLKVVLNTMKQTNNVLFVICIYLRINWCSHISSPDDDRVV